MNAIATDSSSNSTITDFAITDQEEQRSRASSGIEMNLPEETFPRIVHFGTSNVASNAGPEPNAPVYSANKITTSKYTPLTFIPLNLMEQFQKAANVYFVVMSLIMYVGFTTNLFVSTIGPFSVLGVLALMMTLSAFVAGMDDYKRHQADKRTNKQIVKVWRQNALIEVEWGRILVGDIIVILKDEEFPADIVPFACSNEEETVFVSTANLDGETNLKIKSTVSKAADHLCGDQGDDSTLSNIDIMAHGDEEEPLLAKVLASLSMFNCIVEAEGPQKSIHTFSGRLLLGANMQDLLPENLLLRGTQLKNTAWCLGGVVYTGTDTRLAMNSFGARAKLANMEIVINYGMIVILIVQTVLSAASSLMYCISKKFFLGSWYLFPDGDEEKLVFPEFIAYLLTFNILYSNLMPISMYACMEVCNGFLAYFIKCDRLMYDEEQDCNAAVRSTNLVHELGQVAYIFSDKTGTLTQNVMELAKVSVGGEIYDCRAEYDSRGGGRENLIGSPMLTDPVFTAFLENLAVCHTVMAIKEDEELRYEAESPDEDALVKAAAKLGWVFSNRTRQSVIVDVASTEQSYTVVALNAFTSDRKRMSMIVNTPTGEYLLLIKGADNFILERAKPGDDKIALENDLHQFATEGLRTLVLAKRYLDKETCEAWLQEYERAQKSGANRTEELAAVAEKIEIDLEIIGATAIEDKLQDGVGETIVRIREAGIKFWVLTGDKVETAINIGFSTNVLNTNMTIIEPRDCNQIDIKAREVDMAEGDVALIVTGDFLQEVASFRSELQFFRLARKCSVVIACRVSPKQKADMVRLAREGETPTPVTLAIGDGANDVPMILQAQIGVGISGREGRQAVNSSDFSIAQFKFLQRLLLVHGHWNYRRACKFILYTYWKNSVLVLVLFYYNIFSGFSGTSMFEDMVWTSFNIVLAWPIMATCLFDQDVSAQQAIENPRVYETGRIGTDLNQSKIVWNFLSAFVHSFIPFGMIWLALEGMDFAGMWDYYTFGTAMYSWLVVGMNYRAAFATSTWNWISVACIVLSFVTYIVFLGGYCSLQINPPMYGVAGRIASEPIFWFGMLVVPTLAMALDIFKTFMQLEFLPDNAELVQETAHMTPRTPPPARDLQPRSMRSDTRSDTVDNVDLDASYGANLDASYGAVRSMRGFSESSVSFHAQSSFAFDHPEAPPRHSGSLRPPRRRNRDITPLHRIRRAQSRVGNRIKSCCAWLEPDSKFAQQELSSYQFSRDWRLTMLAMFVGGTVLVVVGVITILLSQGCFRIDIHYDGIDSDPFTDPDLYVYKHCPTNGTTNSCVVNITIPEKMAPPISIFYMVKPFYQSYQSYLKSVVYTELQGKKTSAADRSSNCGLSTRVDSAGNQIVPCGLQAASFFNDTFEVMGFDIDTSKLLDDTNVKFANPSDYPDRDNTTWLYERYPTLVNKEEGVLNPHFAIWMKPSALARLTKPYGNVHTTLQKGQNLSIRINASFPVETLEAEKRISLASQSRLGGSNDLLWQFCFGSGALCYFFGFVVLGVGMFCPRPAGQKRNCCRRNGTTLDAPVAAASFAVSDSARSTGSIVAPLISSSQ